MEEAKIKREKASADNNVPISRFQDFKFRPHKTEMFERTAAADLHHQAAAAESFFRAAAAGPAVVGPTPIHSVVAGQIPNGRTLIGLEWFSRPTPSSSS